MATFIILASWPVTVHNSGDLALLVALSVYVYVASDFWLPAFQIDVSLVLALAAIILTGPIGALIVLAIPELLRAYLERQHVRRIATAANLASYAWQVLVGGALLLALATAHATLAERWFTYVVIATAMALANFSVTRGIIGGFVDRVLISGWRIELRALAACLSLVPFAALTACLVPRLGILALIAVAAAQASLSVLVHLVTWTPRAGSLSVSEARVRYAAALASRMPLSRSERRVLLAAARSGSGRAPSRLTRASDRDRVAKTLILAGLWSKSDDCFTRLQPAEMGIESRVLRVAHAWAELTASGTEQLEHRLALLTLHNNPHRYDNRIVAVARGLIPEAEREMQAPRVPYARALPRRVARLKSVA